MAEDFLEELYREADTYTSLCNLVRRYRNGHADSDFLREINSYNEILTEICNKIIIYDSNAAGKIWASLVSLKTKKELNDCLDTIEEVVIPGIYDYLDKQPKIDVTDDNIQIRSSKAGFLYLSNTNSGNQYDSRVNPMQEAYEITRDYYDYTKYSYLFLGCGLAYIPYQFYKASDGDISITILFHDEKEYEYAKLYGVLDWIPEENLQIIVSNDIITFMTELTKKYDDYYIYFMTYEKYPLEEIKIIENLKSYQITRLSSDKYNYINYCHNVRHVPQYFTEMTKENTYGKVAIVAGGPSVDDNIEFLRFAKENGITIIAVGTVFKKLLKLGIKPDIVTACDPYISTLSQFTDLENCEDITLILGAATYQRVARIYSGSKYLATIDNNPKEAKDRAMENGSVIVPSCGTVTTFSYHIAKELGAKEIYLIGADYGYPNGFSHAEGTAERKKIEGDGYTKIKAVDGSFIYASQKLIEYRLEMEEVIEQNPEISTYNLSKNGAFIKGTK